MRPSPDAHGLARTPAPIAPSAGTLAEHGPADARTAVTTGGLARARASFVPSRRARAAKRFAVGGVVLALLLAACSGGAPGSAGDGDAVRPAPDTALAPESPQPSPRPGSPPAGSSPSAAAPSPAHRDRPRVVFLGDSLTAGYGLAEEQAFPALLGTMLAAGGHPVDVVNAGVSGDTSAGGLARLAWILRQNPDVVVVELGPNDGLRGQPLAATESNLREIVERCRAAGARVLLVGMQIPPNYGADYAGGFRALYPRLARELSVPLVPFLLAGVGGEPALNQADGLHPNVEGEAIVARNVLPYLEKVVEELPERAGR